ncbi:hypothetical protein [Pseudomonas savastanoi]|uniref:Uncharacterized protein n=1 Tax=Pseudomonas savastanoi TaxID=29438 RepID=A0A3M6A833_PSESS|nr:hypothetical protein [Pseudomonas savastanoi]KPX03835.1 hypothetical protein ALO74_200027 [Pseudomonas syringae pv. cunninghamiae]RMV11204.1 hypothetical protein ALP15_200000 [Pseudomonas savastanoi]RMV15455.1 hypothetical protein ALP16_200176 [Pseudomonas savastanoi]
MNVRLALYLLACFFIRERFNFGQMRFCIKVELLLFIGVHHELLEFLRDIIKHLMRNMILTKREGNGQVAILAFVFNAFVHHAGQVKVAVENNAMIEFITGKFTTRLCPFFQIFLNTSVVASNSYQHGPPQLKASPE